MNIIKKITISALLSLSVLGLTTSLSALADGASDAALYCSGCHAGLTVNGVVIGGGAKLCPQRTVSEWTATIDRMNSKGCGVPAGSIAGIASYLAGLGTTSSSSSTTSTSITAPIMSARSLPELPRNKARGISTSAKNTSCWNAFSCLKAAARPAQE